MTPVDIAEKQLAKHERRYQEAATTMAAAVAEAGLCAASAVIAQETGATAVQRVRAEVRREGIVRRVLDGSGSLAASVLQSSLRDPFVPDAFSLAALGVAKLLATAWRAGGGR